MAHVQRAPVLVYSTAEPEKVSHAQEQLGAQQVGAAVRADTG
jgi:uncharacterized protein YgbK (DUF1537 family)